MSEQQPILLREPRENRSSEGPVFESGPGWGVKVKKWLGKYFYKVVLPIIILALIIYGISTRQKPTESISPTETPIAVNNAAISEVVGKGDGMINIARRAIASYLLSNPLEMATPGQRVYAETALAATIDKSTFKIGNTIIFNSDKIKSLLDDSKQLTAGQLIKWDGYAKSAGMR
jgi:hypothetical protein